MSIRCESAGGDWRHGEYHLRDLHKKEHIVVKRLGRSANNTQLTVLPNKL